MAKLAAYRAKRDFGRTAEPKGRSGRVRGDAFVVQKHDATRLHYDLRLELDGVMKSWAVAKGPSLVPGDKRLAIHVEDHPIDYNTFEGTIPAGEYGGGTVLVWDRGHWIPNEDPRKGYAKGHLDFRLEGEKLHGSFHLVRMKKRPRERQEGWLLIKQDDEAARSADAPDILEAEPRSVASGRTIEEIAEDPKGKVWHSKEGDAAEARAMRTSASQAPRDETVGEVTASLTRGTAKRPLPKTVEPCLATLSDTVPSGGTWLHEIKWDGYRLIAIKSARDTRLLTRRGLDWTARFPSIAEAVSDMPVSTLVLDGEAVVEDARGVPSFSALQSALSDEHGKVARDAILYAFDLLFADGHDLRGLPLAERKARLATILPPGGTGTLRLSEHLDADGEAMARSARAIGLEGIVSKRADRPYRSGRGGDWLKIKFTQRQEFVIVGYMPSTASEKAVGSLVLGYNQGKALRLAGRAGTGYTAKVARMLRERLHPLRRKTPPLTETPTSEERRGIVWVEPTLVAEIEFRGWTGEDRLRHAAFQGLRDDKSAEDVVREDEPSKAPEKAAKPARRKSGVVRAKGAAEMAGIRLTHPDRILWPDVGLTKRGLADYYEAVAERLLPHVADRPLSLIRCPEGIAGSCFFQKHAFAGLDEHVRRKVVKGEELLFVEGLPGIVALVQASVLEIHPWGTRMAHVERPDRITMDLDPGEGIAWADVVRAARDMRERLGAMKLESFVKTTGGKGLHVVVPIGGRPTWEKAKAFAKSIADAMEADDPARYVAISAKKAREGRVYVDYLRNGRGATAVAAYSTRARPGAPVSTPVAWNEIERLRPDAFTAANLPARLAGAADPWDGIEAIGQTLPSPSRTKRRRS
jgi:bifunctional non-homologous end joining protein LigD